MAIEYFTTQEVEKEEWRDVKGYEGYYSVSNIGRVRRELTRTNGKAGRILRPDINRAGYKQLFLYREGVRRRLKVYRLVAEAFIGPCPQGFQVNHIDGTPANNRVENLEYVTPSGNMQHALKMGRRAIGEQVNTAKLSAEQVLLIRELYKQGIGGPTLAKRFKVKHPSVYAILDRKTWKHI